MAAENGFKQVVNCSVNGSQVLDKLVQPSYTLFALIRYLALYKAS